MREWWNWQTHHLEGVAPVRACEFKSRLAHHFSLKCLTFVELRGILPQDINMRTAITFLLLLVLTTSFVVAEIISNGSLQATSDGANVLLHWVTQDETNVQQFEIERRTGIDGGYTTIAVITAKGASSYDFVDYSALRKSVTIYQYRIKIVFSNGAPSAYAGPVTVSHTVSGVRRTWGSIKAMFR